MERLKILFKIGRGQLGEPGERLQMEAWKEAL